MAGGGRSDDARAKSQEKNTAVKEASDYMNSIRSNNDLSPEQKAEFEKNFQTLRNSKQIFDPTLARGFIQSSSEKVAQLNEEATIRRKSIQESFDLARSLTNSKLQQNLAGAFIAATNPSGSTR